MKHTLRIFLTILVCLLIAFPAITHADFGDFSGDTDFGSDWGSDWDSDWDSDWGSDWDSDWDDDWDSDWDDSYDSSWNSGNVYYIGGFDDDDYNDGDDGFETLLGFIIIVVIVLMVLRMRKKMSAQNRPQGAARTDIVSLRPMSDYMQLDPNFDATALEEKLANLYVQMQNGWQAKDIASLRPYFTDALFAQMERQLDSHRKAGRTNYIERIAVLGVQLRGFKQSNEEDHIIAELRTRIVDYTLDDATGKLLAGNRTKEKFMTYEWDLARTTGVQTPEQAEVRVQNCPNCGAPLNINATAKCPYCDSIVTVEQNDWAISAIRGLSQRTM